MKRPKLSLKRHQELGEELARISDFLAHLVVELDAHRDIARRRSATIAAIRTRDSLAELRSRLDAQCCREYPDYFDTAIYYPHRQPTDHRYQPPLPLKPAASVLAAKKEIA